ncbi:ACP S-malonyltransferase [Cardiobacteriaceae bacterium TAE3-ERU3]|nr:ACP S-malonyltransferase [Cardiobacteriaceae bacterium TAE3-ERU3]
MTTAIIFPGQGSQSQQMLSEMAAQFSIVKQRFDEASEVIGKDLWQIVQENNNAELNQTAITQPVLLAAGIACFDILKAETDINPVFMAGHSLGEYTALCAAQAISFAEAIDLVHQRGELMQEAVPYGEGSMAAILGLEDQDVIEICAMVDETVQAANFNAPGQVVIAGTVAGVAAAIESAKKHGAKRAIELPVSIPSHCSLMKGAAAKLSLSLDHAHWKMPNTTIIHNVDGQERHNVDGIKSALGAQLYKPVQWVKCIDKLVAEGVTYCVEAGPGKVLTGLNKRINKELKTTAFDQPSALPVIIETLESV